MKFLTHQDGENQWRQYQELEAIPENVSNPMLKCERFLFGLDWTWRKLITLLVAELAAEKRIEEYLDRCWALNESANSDQPSFINLKRLWVLMDLTS